MPATLRLTDSGVNAVGGRGGVSSHFSPFRYSGQEVCGSEMKQLFCRGLALRRGLGLFHLVAIRRV